MKPIRGIDGELEAHLGYVIPNMESTQVLVQESNRDPQVMEFGRPPIEEGEVDRLSLWVGERRQRDVRPPNVLRGVDVGEPRQLSRLDSQSCESALSTLRPLPCATACQHSS